MGFQPYGLLALQLASGAQCNTRRSEVKELRFASRSAAKRNGRKGFRAVISGYTQFFVALANPTKTAFHLRCA